MIVSYNTFELFFVVNQVIREIMNTQETNVSQIDKYMYIFTSLCVSRDTIIHSLSFFMYKEQRAHKKGICNEYFVSKLDK